jgi:mRNA interferase MazF
MRRGEVWWAEMGGAAGSRPVVLLSRDEAYDLRSLVVVAPVTSRIRSIPSEVMLTKTDGMPKDCVINLDTITTIKKLKLENQMAALSPKKMEELEATIHFALRLVI